MNNELRETVNYKLAQQYIGFAERVNLFKYIKEAEDFYNGKQYPNNNDSNFLRVSLNICSYSSNIKASKVVGTPVFIKYTSDNENVDCLKLERFDKYNRNKLKEPIENFQSALNGYNDGIDILLTRWDDDDTTYKGIYKGGLVQEHLNPTHFAVANPNLQEIQNQKWVMYWSSEEVAAVREMCEIESLKEHIKPDDFIEGKDDPTSDEVNHRLVTVYTRFFKVDGEVFFMCSTQNVDLFKYPKALNPRINSVIGKKLQKEFEKKLDGEREENIENIPDYDVDYEDMMLPLIKKLKMDDKDYASIKQKFSLYPIALFVPFKINNKFYGRSDVKEQIPIQKAINYGISMMLKCAENNAYNKIIAKDGALKGQVITNEPSQVITDYSLQTNSFGLKFAETPPLPNGLIEFTQKLFEMSREINGYSQVMDGSISNQDISGYAIQQMIKQANTSIEQQQQIFWQFLGDKAAIRLMFYKFYVDKARYTTEIPSYEVGTQEDARQELLEKQKKGKLLLDGDPVMLNSMLQTPTKNYKSEDFSSDEIFDSQFDISIEVEQGLVDSEIAEAQMWDTLIINGGIQNLSPQMLEMYSEANPIFSERTRQVLRGIIARQKGEEVTRLTEENEQLRQYLLKAADLLKQQQQQNLSQEVYNENLTKEFTNKINASNSVISSLQKMLNTQQGQGVNKQETPADKIGNMQ